MKSNLWAKTILSVYKYLERIAGAIDKLVERQALNSYYYFSGSSIDNGVLSVSKRIIELSERKVKLINLKILTENSLKKCDKLLAQILIAKYIDEDTSENIATSLGLTLRTYFRRLNQAEEQFYNNFALQGFNSKKLSAYLANEKWIVDVYQKLVNAQINDSEEFEELIKC